MLPFRGQKIFSINTAKNVKINELYSNLLGVLQQIFVHTDLIKAKYSPEN